MAYHSYRDGCLMVSVLVYVVHNGQDLWCIMMQNYQMSWFTKLIYWMYSQPWEDIDSMLKLIEDFDLWVRP